METLGGTEFAPDTTYLNTSSTGLLPARAVTAMTAVIRDLVAGRPSGVAYDDARVAGARRSFARIAGVGADRVAAGGSVAGHVALVANSLPPGAEILLPEGEYTSVVTPFTVRGDLKLRYAPPAGLADAVRPGTALVAFSAVRSSDGRIADLPAVRAAAAAHGARTLLDASQAAGWLPLNAGEWDFTVTGAFKFLLCPRGVSFLTVTEEAQGTVPPLQAAFFAAEEGAEVLYGPVERLAASARRFDEAPSYLSYSGAERSLELVEEIGVAAIHAHATGLARRFREGLGALGHEPVPGESAVVAVPGLGGRAEGLAREGVIVSDRAGNLRVAFHLYNTAAEADRLLDLLTG
ncbi:aminotransferase class V-fold PLP-dependent enzyme [Streptomyces inusitatus]|uniref:aminotransferase class V-fold PLP-dependent enzyme n=1 Tax=Streptomyces inusitatus TaxID=68221 RepID=UPI00167C82F9|nr:aminotransferase class V-fold PLP-dependent enzyme [Streptomyces inusitatus]